MLRHRSIQLALLIVLLTGIYVFGIAFNVTPWLRGPDEWRWSYVIPGSFQRLWQSALLLLVYGLFLSWWLRQDRPKGRPFVLLLLAFLMTALVQLGLLTLEHQDVRSQLFYRTVSPLSGGFFNVGAMVTNNARFLETYAEQMPTFPVHPQRHPPGLPLLFAWARQLLDQFPELAAAISARLRPYQCHNLALMNLPNSAIASATIQMLAPVALGFVVWPLYSFGRLVYERQTALRAALLWPLVPSVGLWATRWNHLYALFTLLAFLFLSLGLSRRRRLAFLFCGLILWLATWFSLGNLALVLFLGLYALIWTSAQERRPSYSWLAGAAMLAILGLVGPWVLLGRLFHFDPMAIWQGGLGTHLGLGRSYVTWLFYHVYDFFVFLGIPLFVLWAARTVRAFKTWRTNHVDVLAISSAVGLFILNVSGTSQGETARVWAFLIPLFLLVGARALDNRSHLSTVVVTFLVLQLFVSNIFLRPVGTGLTDPPQTPARVTAMEISEPIGMWQDGPVLVAASFPQVAMPGQTIEVQATWSTTAQIQRPYTIFIHLTDAAGTLVAQHDGHPLGGDWLTTCWPPHERFAETYILEIPPHIASGTYELRVGFYWLPTGERLAVEEPLSPDNSLVLGEIELQ